MSRSSSSIDTTASQTLDVGVQWYERAAWRDGPLFRAGGAVALASFLGERGYLRRNPLPTRPCCHFIDSSGRLLTPSWGIQVLTAEGDRHGPR